MDLDDAKYLKIAEERLGILRASSARAKRATGNSYYRKENGMWAAEMLKQFEFLGTSVLSLNCYSAGISPNSFYQKVRYGITYIQKNHEEFTPDIVNLASHCRVRRRDHNVEVIKGAGIRVARGAPEHALAAPVATATQSLSPWDELLTAVTRYIEAGYATGKPLLRIYPMDLDDEQEKTLRGMVPDGFVFALAKRRNIVITKRKEQI